MPSRASRDLTFHFELAALFELFLEISRSYAVIKKIQSTEPSIDMLYFCCAAFIIMLYCLFQRVLDCCLIVLLRSN